MVALIVLVALSAVGALFYIAVWALKQGSATSPTVVSRPAPKVKKK